ncbi:hypothetical protein ACIRL2_51225 [Embleya sp. NPDC127516]|uniref:hypothetical protein n=1 Tax=Embleya sp. NPDC127516 TaxID=3363990 RepID=UPI003800A3EC
MAVESVPPWDPPTAHRGGRSRLPLLPRLSCSVLLFGFVLLCAVGIASSLIWGDGTPGDLRIDRNEAVGTWRDGDGGSLTLNMDGTFQASALCGHYRGASSTEVFDLTPRTGSGTWTFHAPETGSTEVRLTFAQVRDLTSFTSGGTHAKPVLWQWLGDPDEGRLCKLHRAP